MGGGIFFRQQWCRQNVNTFMSHGHDRPELLVIVRQPTCPSEEPGCRAKVNQASPVRHDPADSAFVGFTADVVARIVCPICPSCQPLPRSDLGQVQSTAFNPALTLPLLLFALYTTKGRELSLGHDRALSRLKLLIYIGIARVVNGFLSRGAQNNWQSSKYEWEKEIAVITGGSDGIGKNIAFLLAERGVKIASLDMQPPTFESREFWRPYCCSSMF